MAFYFLVRITTIYPLETTVLCCESFLYNSFHGFELFKVLKSSDTYVSKSSSILSLFYSLIRNNIFETVLLVFIRNLWYPCIPYPYPTHPSQLSCFLLYRKVKTFNYINIYLFIKNSWEFCIVNIMYLIILFASNQSAIFCLG